MLDGWALAVAILAFMVSGAALVIAWWQLVLQRDAAGGRGIIFDVRRPHRTVARRGGVETITDAYHAAVRSLDIEALKPLAGPEAESRWAAMSVSARRAVLETLGIEVVLLPREKRGPGFEPETIDIRWKL
jgi:hypothetical protein